MTTQAEPLKIVLDELVLQHGLDTVIADLATVCSFRADIAFDERDAVNEAKWNRASRLLCDALFSIRRTMPKQRD